MTDAETKFMAMAEDILIQSTALLANTEKALLARERSWIGELRTIDTAMARVQQLARRIVELAIDAQVEISIECDRLEKEKP